ncbi:hypothetical protein Fmac_030375 [Flemingia macrophylla]|uniref:Uncharacterized protein n=1 Tax=Flemingia macrophylla TaxID=520843 RepID=A0ABD1LD42_9FABA
MRDSVIAQSGKYNDTLDSGLNFEGLVVTHKTFMYLVEQGMVIPGENLSKPMKSPEAGPIYKGSPDGGDDVVGCSIRGNDNRLITIFLSGGLCRIYHFGKHSLMLN